MPKIYLDRGRRMEKIKYDSIDVSGKFIQVYDDIYKNISDVKSPCAFHLLFWVVHNMGTYNQIVLNKNARSEFIADSKGRYKDSTVKNAISILVKNKLMVSMSEEGKRESTYFVNPFHFWKNGSQKERAESIKAFLYKIEEK